MQVWLHQDGKSRMHTGATFGPSGDAREALLLKLPAEPASLRNACGLCGGFPGSLDSVARKGWDTLVWHIIVLPPLTWLGFPQLPYHLVLPEDGHITAPVASPLAAGIERDFSLLFLPAGREGSGGRALRFLMAPSFSSYIYIARSSAVQELRLASAFLGEASIDIICLVARVMLSTVTVKRTLWLRP